MPIDDQPELLTYAEAAARLGVRVSWLQDQVQARRVPHRRLGRQVRFAEADLSDIIAAARHAPLRSRARHEQSA